MYSTSQKSELCVVHIIRSTTKLLSGKKCRHKKNTSPSMLCYGGTFVSLDRKTNSQGCIFEHLDFSVLKNVEGNCTPVIQQKKLTNIYREDEFHKFQKFLHSRFTTLVKDLRDAWRSSWS